MITHVAILDRNNKVWALPSPNRHHHVISLMHKEGNAKYLLGQHTQGFVNDKGEFLNRTDAWYEASRCNQLLPPYNPTNPSQRRWDLEVNKTPTELFSEDLW